jgi:tRNA-modifying protein YgfZ
MELPVQGPVKQTGKSGISIMGSSLLTDRGVIKVAGGDAADFLQKVVTANMLGIAAGEARFTALLTPQGKLMFDFFVVPLPDGAEAGFYFDCVKDQAPDLAKRINFLKLRAKITVEDQSEGLGVAAFWNEPVPAGFPGTVYGDPRAAALGSRVIAPHAALAEIATPNEEAYEAHRIALGVARGGRDFRYGETFPHDVNLDFLHGVDFKKGCYIGQEVVSRVHFRKSARKRIVRIRFDGPAPAVGTEIVAGGMTIGEIGSVAGRDGLASARIDRIQDAKTAGLAFKAGETTLEIIVPPEFVEAAAGAEKLL